MSQLLLKAKIQIHFKKADEAFRKVKEKEEKMELNLQKKEALRRLEYLVSKGLHPDVLKMMENDLLCCSDCIIHNQPILYTFEKDNNVPGEWIEKVNKAAKDYDIYVYHISHCFTAFGELLNLFYVTSAEDEWEEDWVDLKQGYPFSYVINLDVPYFSEFGSIGIEIAKGGIFRTQ